MSEQSRWLAAAWAEHGQREHAGRATNTRIAALYRAVGHEGVASDEVAWCAAFVGACLERSGIGSTRSLMARSYLAWGETLAAERIGAVAVLSRGRNTTLGHVGFLVGWTESTVLLLGGNQDNGVSVAAFPRSRLLSLRWPRQGAKGAPDPARRPVEESIFDTALAHVLDVEGGYSDDPHDPGGPTNKGITLATLAAHRGRPLTPRTRGGLIAALRSIGDDEVRSIYRDRYWRPAGCEGLTPPLAVMHFDAAVNHGVGTAIRLLQRCVGAEIDGIIGPLTRQAIGARPLGAILATYRAARDERYRALPHFWRFGKGWLRRSAKTAVLAERLAAALGPADGSVEQQGDTRMAKATPVGKPAAEPTGKWWGHSLTIWGALTTAAAALAPMAGTMLGIELDAETVRQLGSETVTAAQAVAALLGTVMTVYGRIRATQPLQRRAIELKV
ncbi:MAG: TIGR02594 family protein [Hyphomicrobiaceae bacterium]|nr:TIGR02594 family protein [Hyphomicrobiaceae bacterium]